MIMLYQIEYLIELAAYSSARCLTDDNTRFCDTRFDET